MHLYPYSTPALEVGGWSVPRSGRFIPREREPVTIVQEAGWARKISLPYRFEPRTTVAGRYTDYAILDVQFHRGGRRGGSKFIICHLSICEELEVVNGRRKIIGSDTFTRQVE